MLHLLFAVTLLFVETSGLFLTNDRPHHASCKVEWDFGIQCDEVRARLRSQIIQWSTQHSCHDDRCKYELLLEDVDTLRAKHTATSFHYINDIEFIFINGTNDCKVHGFSRAEDPLAYFDGSTNYCGMHMLITGSSLDKDTGYNEVSSDKICTQYSEANC
ncbi:uncharacterized protein [Magallana gigas]|uniref:uncharacterized protein n=1 Tax=Magallana gigas TaxID=29159 RepID=UPI003342A6F3